MKLIHRLVSSATLALGGVVVLGVGLLVPAAPVPVPMGATELEPRTTTVCSVADGDSRKVELVAAGVGTGRLSLTEIGGAEVASLSTSGAVAMVVGAKPYGVMATGKLAAASGGALVAATGSGVDRGVAAQPCLLPATDHWFVGLGAKAPQLSTLLVTNPDSQAAEVEVRVNGPQGAVTAPGSSGIAVPPHSTRVIPLEGMVEADGPLAVQVRATAGRVRVVAQDRHRDGTEAAGTDWIAPTLAPATSFVIPGVAQGAGARDLILVNPGERTATAKVEALAADGSFVVEGADAVDVPPASTVRVPLADALGGDAVGLRVTSDVALAGALEATATGSKLAPDTATAVATRPMSGMAVLPLVAVNDLAGQVQLSNAGPAATSATLVVTDRSGKEMARQVLQLPAGGTVGVPVTGNGAWAQVSTDGAEVYGAVVLTSTRDATAGLGWLPVSSSRVATPAPEVRTEPRLGW